MVGAVQFLSQQSFVTTCPSFLITLDGSKDCKLNPKLSCGEYFLGPASPVSIKVYYDADWASGPDDRGSTSSAHFYIFSNIVSLWARE